MLPYGLAWVGLLGCLSACGQLDSEERWVDSSPPGGVIIASPMSDSDLYNQNAEVNYRFKSVPNLVLVKSLPTGGQYRIIGEALTISSDKNSARFVHKETKLTGTGGLRVGGVGPSEAGNEAPSRLIRTPFQEARFDEAAALLKYYNVHLGDVPVAIVDSGVVPVNESLKKALVTSQNLTIDGNEDGWQSHATAIASVFTGIEKKGETVSIYSPNSKISSFKIAFEGDESKGPKAEYGGLQLAVALDKAVSEGAKIVNLSFAYRKGVDSDISVAERFIMKNAAKKGVIFVAAAGNYDTNIDTVPLQPARYDLDNLIVVGSHTLSGFKAGSSNYGNSVDLTAPGALVELTEKGKGLGYFSGTSFAVPMVVAALSQYFGILPDASLEQAMGDLYATTADGYAGVENIQVSRHGRLDTGALVALALKRKGVLVESFDVTRSQPSPTVR